MKPQEVVNGGWYMRKCAEGVLNGLGQFIHVPIGQGYCLETHPFAPYL